MMIFNKKKIWLWFKLPLGIFIVSLCLIGFSGRAKAASIIGAKTNQFPDYNTNVSHRSEDLGLVQLLGQGPNGNGDPTDSGTWWKKNRAKKTVVSIYVPKASIKNDNSDLVTIEIQGGCDNDTRFARDRNQYDSKTNFYFQRGINLVGGGTIRTSKDDHCMNPGGPGYSPDIVLQFNPDPSDPDDRRTSNVYTASPDEEYYVYDLIADAQGGEVYRYLNGFRVAAWSPGVYVGASLNPVQCNPGGGYLLSCPPSSLTPPYQHVSGISWAYSSFFMKYSGDTLAVDFQSDCENDRAQMFIFDLDADDGSLGQNLNIQVYIEGIGTIPYDHNYISSHGGNNDETFKLPSPGFADADGLFKIQKGKNHRLSISGMSSGNAFQVLPHIIQGSCVNNTPPEGDIVAVCDPATWQVTLKRARVQDAEGGRLTVTATKVVDNGADVYNIENKTGSKIVDKGVLTAIDFTDPNNTFTVPVAYRDRQTRRIQGNVEDNKGVKTVIYGSFKCENTRPTGEIVATCDKQTAIVTIRAKVKDPDGGVLRVTAYQVRYADGTLDQWLGSQANPNHRGQKDVDPEETVLTTIDYQPTTFNGRRDDRSHYVVGEVTDSGGMSSQIISNRYTCANAPPTGRIDANCVDGVVTIKAYVKDEEGGLIRVVANGAYRNGVQVDAFIRRGSKTITASPNTERLITFTDPSNTFTSARDNLQKRITGTVTDSLNQSTNMEGFFTCEPPDPEPGRCPRAPTFFDQDNYWKRTNGVNRQLPADEGTRTGIGATDYTNYSFIDDKLSNVRVTASGETLRTRPAPDANGEVSLWLLDADYERLFVKYPYDTHTVTGTARFDYTKSYERLQSMTVTWWQYYLTADGYYDYAGSKSASDPNLLSQGYVTNGVLVSAGAYGMVYIYWKWIPPTYGWVTQTITYPAGTAYTPPPNNARGGWSVFSANPTYRAAVVTQQVGDVNITFPQMPDCYWRRVSIQLSKAAEPSWDDTENPTRAKFSTRLTTTFRPDIYADSPVGVGLRTQTRVNAGSNFIFDPIEFNVGGASVRGGAIDTLDYQVSGDFTPPNLRPTIPLTGTSSATMQAIEIKNETSNDEFKVTRGDTAGSTKVYLGDCPFMNISATPLTVLVNSAGVVQRVRDPGTTEVEAGNSSGNCAVVDKPYFRFYNTDAVVTGMPFANAQGTCTPDNNASLRGFRSIIEPKKGSSSQVGAFASGDVDGVSSSVVPSVIDVSRLTYSNFGAMGDCLPDYYNAPKLSDQPANFPGISNMQNNTIYRAGSGNGSVTDIGGSLPDGGATGVRSALYVNGDVRITSNITYPAKNYANASEMPYLLIVASGSIKIAPGVTNVDGVLVSQGSSIDTCADILTQNLRTACTTPLTINGAVVANRLRPRRAVSTINQAIVGELPGSEKVGDSFQLIPEVLIAKPPLPETTKSLDYDSMTELPPLF